MHCQFGETSKFQTNFSELRNSAKFQTKINSLKVAKEKAKQYAEAIDQEIGKALFIKEVEQSPYTQSQMRAFNTSNTVLEQELKEILGKIESGKK